MRLMTLAASLAVLTGAVIAQTPKIPGSKAVKMQPAKKVGDQAQDDLAAKRKKKLSKPVFKLAAWHFDYDEARAQAKKEGKFLLTYFTRSYAP